MGTKPTKLANRPSWPTKAANLGLFPARPQRSPKTFHAAATQKKRRSILHFSALLALFRTFRSLIPLPYYSSPFFQRRFYSCYQTFFSTGGLFLLSITCACRLLLQNLDETSNETKSPLKKLPPLRGRTKVAKVGPPRARVKTQIC